MVDLIANSPASGLLPVNIGGIQLFEMDLGVLTSIAPFCGAEEAVTQVLTEAHGLAWPKPNRSSGKDGARAIWFGHRTVLLAGPPPDERLSEHAALNDQSDAWVSVTLKGAGAEDVLARVTALDLRASTFKRGHTARTDLQHMPASISRLGSNTFLVLTFRSFAGTLVHDLSRAARGVAARSPG